jgi:hypothetical protein
LRAPESLFERRQVLERDLVARIELEGSRERISRCGKIPGSGPFRPASAGQVREAQVARGLGPVGALALLRCEGLDGQGAEPGPQQRDTGPHE